MYIYIRSALIEGERTGALLRFLSFALRLLFFELHLLFKEFCLVLVKSI